jgi:hypothetical protein
VYVNHGRKQATIFTVFDFKCFCHFAIFFLWGNFVESKSNIKDTIRHPNETIKYPYKVNFSDVWFSEEDKRILMLIVFIPKGNVTSV